MQHRHSIYANEHDEEIIKKVLDKSGRDSLSEVTVRAFTVYYKSICGESPVTLLPDWKVFDKTLTDADDIKFKELYKRAKQLYMIAEAKKGYRKVK